MMELNYQTQLVSLPDFLPPSIVCLNFQGVVKYCCKWHFAWLDDFAQRSREKKFGPSNGSHPMLTWWCFALGSKSFTLWSTNILGSNRKMDLFSRCTSFQKMVIFQPATCKFYQRLQRFFLEVFFLGNP